MAGRCFPARTRARAHAAAGSSMQHQPRGMGNVAALCAAGGGGGASARRVYVRRRRTGGWRGRRAVPASWRRAAPRKGCGRGWPHGGGGGRPWTATLRDAGTPDAGCHAAEPLLGVRAPSAALSSAARVRRSWPRTPAHAAAACTRAFHGLHHHPHQAHPARAQLAPPRPPAPGTPV